MLSKKSFRLLKWIIIVGDILKILPYTYKDEAGLQTRKRNSYAYCIWLIFGGILICVRLSWILLNVLLIGFVFKDAERFVAIYYLSAELLTTPLHVSIYMNPDQFAVPMSALLYFNQLQMRYFRVSPETKDGLEGFWILCRILPVVTITGALIVGPKALEGNMPYLRYFNTGNRTLNYLLILTATNGFTMYCVFNILALVWVFIYFNSLYLWQKKIQESWEQKYPLIKARATLRKYVRAHQVLHATYLESITMMFSNYILVGEVLVVTSMFQFIKCVDSSMSIDIIINFIVGQSVFCLMSAAFYLISRVLEVSGNVGTQRRCTRLSAIGQTEMKSFVKSLRPLKWKLGGTVTITKQTILTVVGDVIIQNVINLLVTY